MPPISDIVVLLFENPAGTELKEHVAWDRSPWSLKCVCNRLLYNSYDYKDILKGECNDPHKYHSKLRGFPFTSSTNAVGHFMGVNL